MRRRRVLLLAMAALLAIVAALRLVSSRTPRVTYAEARAVVDRRCVTCHSEHPTSRVFPITPKGVRLDTPEQMREHAPRIEVRVVTERTMPIANMTGMTDDERRILGAWVEQGAPIP